MSERKVLIPELMRKRARALKCVPEVKDFEACVKESGLLMPFKCKAVTDKYKDCMAHWFYDESFITECTQVYLNERSEYRRTGISKKQREQMAAEQQQANNT